MDIQKLPDFPALAQLAHSWDNAAGHVTLWNGIICADTCHLVIDPGNGKFIPDVAALWVLP